MYKVLSFHSILECFGHFVGETCKYLILHKAELHLLIRKYLAEGRLLEEVDKDESALAELDVDSVVLDAVFNLSDYFLVGIFAWTQSEFIFLVLVAVVDINHA